MYRGWNATCLLLMEVQASVMLWKGIINIENCELWPEGFASNWRTFGCYDVILYFFISCNFFWNFKFKLQGLAMMQIKEGIAICANHILQKFKRPSLTFDPSVVHWLPLADAIIKLSQTSSSCSTANQIMNRCQSKIIPNPKSKIIK